MLITILIICLFFAWHITLGAALAFPSVFIRVHPWLKISHPGSDGAPPASGSPSLFTIQNVKRNPHLRPAEFSQAGRTAKLFPTMRTVRPAFSFRKRLCYLPFAICHFRS